MGYIRCPALNFQGASADQCMVDSEPRCSAVPMPRFDWKRGSHTVDSACEFSFRHGYSFVFEDNGQQIRLWCSAFSGLEKLYLNDELLDTRRRFARQAATQFFVGPDEYTVNLNTISMLRGPHDCMLSKNGLPIKKKRLVFPDVCSRKKGIRFLPMFTISLLAGVVFGTIKSLAGWPGYSLLFFILGVYGFWTLLDRRLGAVPIPKPRPRIEDVELGL